MEEPDASETSAEQPPGIVDVKSGSKEVGSNGQPYNTW